MKKRLRCPTLSFIFLIVQGTKFWLHSNSYKNKNLQYTGIRRMTSNRFHVNYIWRQIFDVPRIILVYCLANVYFGACISRRFPACRLSGFPLVWIRKLTVFPLGISRIFWYFCCILRLFWVSPILFPTLLPYPWGSKCTWKVTYRLGCFFHWMYVCVR